MSFFNPTMSIVENLYYLSGVFVAVFAFIGLFQLFLTKRTIQVSSERDAAKQSAIQIELFFNKIIPLINEFTIKNKGKNYPTPMPLDWQFNHENVKKSFSKKDIALYAKDFLAIADEWIKIANSLEAMSIYFLKGIANEELGFSSIGWQYVNQIEEYYFYYSVLRSNAVSKEYLNSMELYDLWRNRIRKTEFTFKKMDLEKRISEIAEQKIKPIGT